MITIENQQYPCILRANNYLKVQNIHFKLISSAEYYIIFLFDNILQQSK